MQRLHNVFICSFSLGCRPTSRLCWIFTFILLCSCSVSCVRDPTIDYLESNSPYVQNGITYDLTTIELQGSNILELPPGTTTTVQHEDNDSIEVLIKRTYFYSGHPPKEYKDRYDMSNIRETPVELTYRRLEDRIQLAHSYNCSSCKRLVEGGLTCEFEVAVPESVEVLFNDQLLTCSNETWCRSGNVDPSPIAPPFVTEGWEYQEGVPTRLRSLAPQEDTEE